MRTRCVTLYTRSRGALQKASLTKPDVTVSGMPSRGYWLRHSGRFQPVGGDWAKAIQHLYALRRDLTLHPQTPPPAPSKPIAAAVEAYLTERRNGARQLASTTMKRISAELRCFAAWAENTDIENLDAVDMAVLNSYAAYRRTQLCSVQSVNQALRVVGTFLRYHGRVVLHSWDLQREEAKEPEPYTPEELQRLFRCRSGNGSLWRFLAYTGLRHSEAMHLEWGDVDFDAGVVTVRPHPQRGFHVKDRQVRQVPLHPLLIRYFRYVSYRRKPGRTDLVFPGPDGKVRHNMRSSLLRDAAKAGVANARLHRFRAVFASYCLLRAKIEPVTVMLWLGHSKMTTMMRHYIERREASSPATRRRLAEAFQAWGRQPLVLD